MPSISSRGPSQPGQKEPAIYSVEWFSFRVSFFRRFLASLFVSAAKSQRRVFSAFWNPQNIPSYLKRRRRFPSPSVTFSSGDKAGVRVLQMFAVESWAAADVSQQTPERASEVICFWSLIESSNRYMHPAQSSPSALIRVFEISLGKWNFLLFRFY